MVKDSKKSHKEICELYTKVSGDVVKMRQYLENKKVTTWSALEDMALMEPDTSVEYQVLL